MSADSDPVGPVGQRAVDEAWRVASREEPSAAADDAILAAARVEAARDPGAGVASPRRRRWTLGPPLFAAAAVAGVALVLVQVLPTQDGVQHPARDRATELGAPPPAPASPAHPTSAESRSEAAAGLAGRETPEAWAARIEALWTEGDRSAAADELRAFRQRHPRADTYLSPAAQAWAKSVDGQGD